MINFTKSKIEEIAADLDMGLSVYYHIKTGEILVVPDMIQLEEMESEGWEESLDKLEENQMDYQQIEPMQSHNSFEVMRDFAEQMPNSQLQNKLYAALNKRKPFREFKLVIDYSGEYRQMWFDFKNKRNIEWVENQFKGNENILISIS